MTGNEPYRSPATVGGLFRAGQLQAAMEAAAEAVRKRPTEAATRILLAEMLLFTGDLERADTILRGMDSLDPGTALVSAEFRQLLRAETARRQVLQEGRPPEFLGSPTAAQACLLQALAAARAGDLATAAGAAAAAEGIRPKTGGVTANGVFNDFRDADDMWAGTFEVLTTTGKCFWIPTERIVTLEPHRPMRPRDLFWRRCTMSVRNGPEGEVYLPALYLTPDATCDALRLGRLTRWTESTPVCGMGQRMFLVGDNGVPMQQLPCLSFADDPSTARSGAGHLATQHTP